MVHRLAPRRPFPGWALLLPALVVLSACDSRVPRPVDGPQATKVSVVPGQEGRITPHELDYMLARLDANADGWSSEVIAARTDEQLARLAELLRSPNDNESLAEELAHRDLVAVELRPSALAVVSESQSFLVRRGSPGAPIALELRGGEALAAMVATMRAVFRPDADLRVATKTIGVDRTGDLVTTRVDVELSGRSAAGWLQQNTVWETTWTVPDDAPPRVVEIRPLEFEEVEASAQQLFVDATGSVLPDDPDVVEQLSRGQMHWASTLDVTLGADIFGHHGITVADVDGDGLDDVYLPQPGGIPNRLLLQREDGRTVERAAEAGLDVLDRTTSALFVDFDNDGDQDLALATGPVTFHENDGHGRFTARGQVSTAFVTCLAAADFDNDGDLDLYACQYSSPEETSPVPYHDANNGARNVLLRNDGGLQFTDVTEETGLDTNNLRFSFAASWQDYDSDGDLDLYVANDFGRNNLYRNDRGRFEDVAEAAGVEDLSAGMGVTWGDYNADGRPDLYVSNMFSSAGNRIAYQRRFRSSEDDAIRDDYRRHARGNSLFQNAGDGTFHDVSIEAGVTMARWAWSSTFADLDNDRRLDLFVANGYVTNDDSHDL